MSDTLLEIYENIRTLSDIEFKKYIKTVNKNLLIEYLIDLLDNQVFLESNSIVLIRTISILVTVSPVRYK